MRFPTITGAGEMALFLPILACALASVLADDIEASTQAETEIPQWAAADGMQLTLSANPGLQFALIPLTKELGVNATTGIAMEIIQFSGNMIATDASNYNKVNNKEDIAYLSCDEPKDNAFLSPNKILNTLMRVEPKLKAIILYSTSKTWCAINPFADLPYTTILSMADGGEATQALNLLNGTSHGKLVKASIFGNNTDNAIPKTESKGGGNTAAMSVLYAITGLITLLFLVIITTGAVRAHRYPERYGPRGALGGRPRQSRAKGLARAVLDTIPIVKFGNQTPAKPDPELELENTEGNDAATQRTASRLGEARPSDATPTAGGEPGAVSAATAAKASSSPEDAENGTGDHLGCSICTEDFEVGEDVRVLPCKHQYHPACVDPWLINVSGTCPLCRYDLRPGKGHAPGEESTADSSSLPPPLAMEGAENDALQSSQRNRLSRLFDINRLREGTVEEQMEALRQMRAETNESSRQETADVAETADGESQGQSARFAARLRDRFRIRTRAQAVEDNESQRESQRVANRHPEV
ncbi:E3 ubiquitin-protein ligase SDIR1 [Fusarium austroafricanum]|uniref:RING-type E3 ubiquitin transferase n=1 Tax=Fusarium austroafricanum TaxID=2364996 RepID=A0A8H4P1F5_9HYPO|nr:E3 ubiquitin-protein ligase SDIR1 [Fusarium austroafricanum]